MLDIYLGLKFSFSYFSILPIRISKTDDLSRRKVVAYMLYFFPLVGLSIASLSVALSELLSSLNWLGILISSLVYVALYGFLHNEAVVDVVDGICAKHSGKDAYAVVQEPTVGALGVFWGVSFFILKLAFIAYAFELKLFWEFICIATVSRFSLIIMIKIIRVKSSFLNTLQDSLEIKYIIFLGVLISVFVKIWILFIGILFTYMCVRIIKSKLGFVNGDVMGMTLEIVEIALLFILVFLWA